MDIPLYVRAESSGRWIKTDDGSQGSALMRFNSVRETIKLSIPNISSVDRQGSFQEALETLPVEFNPSTEQRFLEFFQRWGTHIVYKVTIGGRATLECVVSYNSSTRENLREISVEIGGFFENLSLGAAGNLGRNRSRLSEMGVSMSNISLQGGVSNTSLRLQVIQNQTCT